MEIKEGPGGTKAMAPTNDKSRRQFLEALNFDEAVFWIKEGPTGLQATLSTQWLALRAIYLISQLQERLDNLPTPKKSQFEHFREHPWMFTLYLLLLGFVGSMLARSVGLATLLKHFLGVG